MWPSTFLWLLRWTRPLLICWLLPIACPLSVPWPHPQPYHTTHREKLLINSLSHRYRLLVGNVLLQVVLHANICVINLCHMGHMWHSLIWAYVAFPHMGICDIPSYGHMWHSLIWAYVTFPHMGTCDIPSYGRMWHSLIWAHVTFPHMGTCDIPSYGHMWHYSVHQDMKVQAQWKLINSQPALGFN